MGAAVPLFGVLSETVQWIPAMPRAAVDTGLAAVDTC